MDIKKNPENQRKEPGQDKEAADKTITIKESEYAQLKKEAELARENWDKYLRLQADFENTRKRWERDKLESFRYANEDLLCDLLNVVDDLERTLELSQEKHEDFTAFLKGVEMILSHLHDLLKRNGVTAIKCSGKPFDPNFHEALMRTEKDDVTENTVVEELQKGYLLNNKVLRTAKVKVAVTRADNTVEVKDVELKDKDGIDKI